MCGVLGTVLVVKQTVPAEIHNQLLGFPCVDLEVVLLTPFHKVLDQFSIFPVIVNSDEADDGRVVRELLISIQFNFIMVIYMADMSVIMIKVTFRLM